MKFIRTINDEVIYCHNMPFDPKYGLGKTESELLQEGFLVDSVPEIERIEGKSIKMFYTEANGFTFEYESIPKTPEQLQAEKIEQIENQTAEYMVDLDFRICSIELGL